MRRAEVNVEVCRVEEQDKSNEKRQTKGRERSKKSKTTRKKRKPVESDWETESVASGWEDEDELNASQYLPVDDPVLTLVRKRSASPSTELGNKPAMKRARTSAYEAD